ncbi:putative DNA-binding domain-containing protein [Alcanivorax sp. JB21]|uniref:HvfC family RiPP maturation protein n=1 Tax=Alcanivorax limicola TaxID=2874102 RepID=UPI001CBCAF57|nr:putative DNA-binding domain-containing protein [Alcanivorax limicola]MBZ2187615.1 putative DNA-binding domain-containing protein [Alcanivorax limicola]
MTEQDFQRVQRMFAGHLRDPEHNLPPEGLEDRRLRIYRDLFFNNLDNFLRTGFPVLHSLLPELRWQQLVRDFMRNHTCHSPYFRDIPEAFLAFLDAGETLTADDPPFVQQLAHYEWMELVLDTRDVTPQECDPSGDLLAGAPVLSPLVEVLSYDWPVHQIGAEYQPDAPLPAPVWLLIYRDATDSVRFMEINSVTAQLLALITQWPGRAGEALLRQLATDLAHPDPEAVLRFGADLLAGLRERGVLAGVAPAEVP